MNETRFEYDEERLVSTFLSLVTTDSESGNEGGVTALLEDWFKMRGLEYVRDDSGKKWGSTGDNIIVHIPGDLEGEAIIFNAHQDTVKPGNGVKPVRDGRIIRSDGTTVLGADDKAGIAVLLEALDNILEKKIPHRDMWYLFSTGEEIGMYGVKNLDISLIPCRNFFCLDYSGDMAVFRTSGPGSYKFRCDFTGTASHAGSEPDKGRSAIRMASNAVENMPLGRIDDETTANVGLIGGGQANNIVPAAAWITGEARSRSGEKLEKQIAAMEKACLDAAAKYGGKADFSKEYMYPPAKLDKDWFLSRCLLDAYEKEGITPVFKGGGGGGDLNILYGQGFKWGGMFTGAHNAHTTAEYLDLDETRCCYRVIMRMMTDGFK